MGSRLSSNHRKPLEGFLIVDKPSGISSYDVIRIIRRRLSPRKIGHTGTLDPLASGVLPVVINSATKVIPFLNEKIKRYEGTLQLGVVTDSDDSTGRVLKEMTLDETELTPDRIRRGFEGFLGKIEQAPPMFSAAKHHGMPLYKLARQGVHVERRKRTVEVFSLDIRGIDLPFVDFSVSCSRGTYVRVLARQIGDSLGVGAHLCRLRRTCSGPFTLDQSITLEEFDKLLEVGQAEKAIVSTREALIGMPELEVGADLGARIRNGSQVFLRDVAGLRVPGLERNQQIKIIHEGKVLAIAEAQITMGDPRDQALGKTAFGLVRVFA
ncbi:MAG: tRNA pseudouridine(55) synthase TruB [Proteobacteria bacterium]|nr:tRNA pseudouridine(55) synthase TruB [Pseudomonadota bacterium]